MKKRIASMLLICIMLLGMMALIACDENTDPPALTPPQKLSAPTVTLSDAVATWQADANADKFEISLDGTLSYVENTVTTKTLTDGQTLKVRAVGDGTKYAPSDWSNAVTYTAPADQGPDNNTPTKLATPTVTVSATGLASWGAVSNASGYAYRINGGNETATTATSVQLTDGQSITVKAVGDGTAYTDSDYSAAKTYTASTPPPAGGEEPTYLGIIASNSAPSAQGGLPESIVPSVARMARSGMRYGGGYYYSFEDKLKEYFNTPANQFGTYPTESNYTAYAAAGETVYIQIWLNNPAQHTILSLKLNGTKYQVGGGLTSFFIEQGGQHYNCVYVAVTVPQGSFDKIEYTVSDIEYIADTFINADGTDAFMNENDTVTVGLPYSQSRPTVSGFAATNVTVNGFTATFNLSDAEALAQACGGWLGVMLYDGEHILANQSAVIGENTLAANGLVEDSFYYVIVYLFADLHDGNGVSAHQLMQEHVATPPVMTVEEITDTLLYNEAKNGYYGAIKVKTALGSASAEYIKLEILQDETVVYTDPAYNGNALISEGILNGQGYTVRVHYRDTEYPEGKYVEEHVWVSYLGSLWMTESKLYSLVRDGVYYFRLDNGDENYPALSGFTFKAYSRDSAQYVAEQVLVLLENENIIQELDEQISALNDTIFNYPHGSPEQIAVMSQIDELQAQQRVLQEAERVMNLFYDGNRDPAFWRSEAAKGQYLYEFTFDGTNTDTVFRAGKFYFIVLDDLYTLDFDRLEYDLVATYDPNDGSGMQEYDASGSFRIANLLTDYNGTELRDVTLNGDQLTFTLYNVDDYNRLEIEEPYYKKGYVYKIYVRGDYMTQNVLYLNNDVPVLQIDEEAWLAEFITLIKAGESIDGLFPKYVPSYENPYTVTLDLSSLGAGNINLYVLTRKIAEAYAEGEYDRELMITVSVTKQLPTPTLVPDFENVKIEHEFLGNWWGDYIVEAFDKDNNPVEVIREGAYIHQLPVGTRVRAKLGAHELWQESEWSEWYTFEATKLGTPSISYSTENCTATWGTDDSYVAYWIYTVNGGEQLTFTRDEMNQNVFVLLSHGDVLRVKAVANEEAIANSYTDSEWAVFTCDDNRIPLAVPSARIDEANELLVWDPVDGAEKYLVEFVLYGTMLHTEEISGDRCSTYMKVGTPYRVRAIPADTTTYKPSAWSEEFVLSLTLENPTFNRVSSGRVRWNSVSNASGYNYKIGENGTVQQTVRTYIEEATLAVGDKLYVQAYADYCTPSEWVLIYEKTE